MEEPSLIVQKAQEFVDRFAAHLEALKAVAADIDVFILPSKFKHMQKCLKSCQTESQVDELRLRLEDMQDSLVRAALRALGDISTFLIVTSGEEFVGALRKSDRTWNAWQANFGKSLFPLPSPQTGPLYKKWVQHLDDAPVHHVHVKQKVASSAVENQSGQVGVLQKSTIVARLLSSPNPSENLLYGKKRGRPLLVTCVATKVLPSKKRGRPPSLSTSSLSPSKKVNKPANQVVGCPQDRAREQGSANTVSSKASVENTKPTEDSSDDFCFYAKVSANIGPRAKVRPAAVSAPIPSWILPSDAAILKGARWSAHVLKPRVSNSKGEEHNVSRPWAGLGVVPTDLPTNFHSLLILGASGSGKSTLLRTLVEERFPSHSGQMHSGGEWGNCPIIEAFPDPSAGMNWLCALGLSSVPAWFKPFSVLSRGEQYRANAAWKLATLSSVAVFDEWTSDLDRGVARAVSLALARSLLRKRRLDSNVGPVVLATCHDDVADYLGCDVVVRCEAGAAPRVVFNAYAEHASTILPELCVSFAGSITPFGEANDGIEGRYRVISGGKGFVSDFSIRSKRNASAKTELEKLPMTVSLHAHGLNGIKLERTQTIKSWSSEDRGEDIESGPWFRSKEDDWHFRVRVMAKNTLMFQTKASKSAPWTEMVAERVPQLYSHTASPMLLLRGNKGLYEKVIVEQMQKSGWYIPPERCDDSTCLYPGLRPVCEKWFGRLDQTGEGFRFNPQHERKWEGLTHLVTYVGQPKGGLSEALISASIFMDHPFDGLCVHQVPSVCLEDSDFGVGVVLGPSGSGKTALVTEHFGPASIVHWSDESSVRAHFPQDESGEEILKVVGLPPDVVERPFATLSGGEQFRSRIARLLISHQMGYVGNACLVLDDFTSVLDRPSARHFAKSVHNYISTHRLRRIVVVSCHTDFVGCGMLEPQWLFEAFSGRLVTFGGVEMLLDKDLRLAKQEYDSRIKAFEVRTTNAFSQAIALEKKRLDTMRKEMDRIKAVAARSMLKGFPEEFSTAVSVAVESAGNSALQPLMTKITNLESQLASELDIGKQHLAEDYHRREAQIRAQHAAREAESVAFTSCPLQLSPPLTAEQLRLVVRRAMPCEWAHFRQYHYKDHTLGSGSVVLVGCLFDEAVALTAIIPTGSSFMRYCTSDHPEWRAWCEANFSEQWLSREMWREHRTVVRPPFQGIGLGSALADAAGFLLQQMGYAFCSVTVHPHYGSYREQSPFWCATPTNQNLSSFKIRGRLKYSHAWKGATSADGSVDAGIFRLLSKRIDFPSLVSCLDLR